jgi:hypothetical protein
MIIYAPRILFVMITYKLDGSNRFIASHLTTTRKIPLLHIRLRTKIRASPGIVQIVVEYVSERIRKLCRCWQNEQEYAH